MIRGMEEPKYTALECNFPLRLWLRPNKARTMVKIKNETNQADLSIPTLSDTDEVSVGKENHPVLVNVFYSINNNFLMSLI